MPHAAKQWTDLRREARWKERRPATFRCCGKDWRSLAADLGLGGVLLAVETVVPEVGEQVTVSFQLEPSAIQLEGVVRHVRKMSWGSVVGVEFDPAGQSRLARALRSPYW